MKKWNNQCRPGLLDCRVCFFILSLATVWAAQTNGQVRPATDQNELRYWLENMVWYHQFDSAEIQSVTGMSSEKITDTLKRFDIHAETRPKRDPADGLLVLPYPGGRHPRIGFLEGAIDPQRETKVSIFTPWDDESYVVADVPEAIWSNLGLTYLAHTHVPTIWTKKQIELERLEWQRKDDGSVSFERKLPNGIRFGTLIHPAEKNSVQLEMWLTNGIKDQLTGLRVQNCVMLKGAAGFEQQTNDNKRLFEDYAVAHDETAKRWIITSWKPIHRTWANPPCPCLHADPEFPDCPPGETSRIFGWISFYEGADIDSEIQRIERLRWWENSPGANR